MINKLIRVTELSTLLFGSRWNLRIDKVNKKQIKKLDKFFLHDLPEMWKMHKNKLGLK